MEDRTFDRVVFFVSGVMHFRDPKSSFQLSPVSTLHCMVECWLDAGLCRKCHRTKVWVHAKVPVSDVGHCNVKVKVIAKIPVLDVGHSDVIELLVVIANAKSRLTCKHLMDGSVEFMQYSLQPGMWQQVSLVNVAMRRR